MLRRFVPRARYSDLAAVDLKNGIFLDVETTGFDPNSDQIIEIALLPFTFDREGRVYAVHEPLWFFNDPGRPIPPEITALTGITNEMVAGSKINGRAVLEELRQADLVIAHSADFDRRFVERLLPAFAAKPWACSQREVPWDLFGVHGAKLVHILLEACGVFFDGHRADADCRAALHALATATHEGRTALGYLLESARAPLMRVYALNAPFDVKDALKRRGYRWDAAAKVWQRDVGVADLQTEREWLASSARCSRPAVRELTAIDRYSDRADL